MMRLGLALLTLLLFVSPLYADSFQQQRRAFRKEIDKKALFDIGSFKNLKAVLYNSDINRFAFKMSQPERTRLLGLVKSFFWVGDDDAGKVVDRLAGGQIIVKKDYRKGTGSLKGVAMSALLLIPPFPYWHRIESIDRAEQTFHVFNVSASFLDEGARPVVYGLYQPEGKFMGITRATTVPMKATRKRAEHKVTFTMPTQEEVKQALFAMQATSPQRWGLEERFVDRMRRHPYFAEKDKKGNYEIDDKTILKMLSVLANMEKKCEVKDTQAYYKVHEGYAGFHVVEYSITSMANIKAIFPNIPLLRSIVERIAQSIADQVSWKYFSLSMKNLRDAVVADAQRRGGR